MGVLNEQDNVIEFKEYLKEHRMYLTDEEYKIIQEMRNKGKNGNSSSDNIDL